ncbi:MAG: hypothetical protein ABEJ26_09475 [Halosimplex sp.]
MSESVDFEGVSLSEQVVLAGVLELSYRGDTPAHAGEVRRACNDAMESVESDALGTVTGAEVSRTLNELEAAGLVEGTRDETTATGKGRPTYRLAVDGDTVRDHLADDERVAPLADRLDSLGR